MISNIERYREDLKKLIDRGDSLIYSLAYAEDVNGFRESLVQQLGSESKADAFVKKLPTFIEHYQAWYSEAKALVRQLLPDRIDDFGRHYEKPKSRKDITFGSYCIEDALQGLHVTKGYAKEHVVGPEAALPHLQQQVAILKGAEARFESSLFDIRQLVQADLFDSEIDAAEHLLKNKFVRAAGAVAGVVLEKHLGEVCGAHKCPPKKKAPSISDLNDALKAASVIDMAQWRFIQHLGDIRNACDHSKTDEPTRDAVSDLLLGVRKTMKTVF